MATQTSVILRPWEDVALTVASPVAVTLGVSSYDGHS